MVFSELCLTLLIYQNSQTLKSHEGVDSLYYQQVAVFFLKKRDIRIEVETVVNFASYLYEAKTSSILSRDRKEKTFI